MAPLWLLAIYCGCIIAASVAGGLIPLYIKMTHRRLSIASSFVGGAMFGVAIFHLLPHAVEAQLEVLADQGRDIESQGHTLLQPIMLWLLAGFLLMFLLERFFCFHHHDTHEHSHSEQEGVGSHGGTQAATHDHRLGWIGAFIGLTVHSMVAGLALAASVSAGLTPDGLITTAAGLGTFLVIVLHKPFDSLTLGALMAVGGAARMRRHLFNLLFSLAVPLGAFLFWLGLLGDEESRATASMVGLSISAGAFFCIALSDLLPELQFHSHDRIALSAALIIGLALAWGVTRLEGLQHDHDHHDHHEHHDHAQANANSHLLSSVPGDDGAGASVVLTVPGWGVCSIQSFSSSRASL